MKKTFCFALVFVFSSLAYGNRSEKLKNSIDKREKKELRREIAREKKKIREPLKEEFQTP
jgi:hypothetical protein